MKGKQFDHFWELKCPKCNEDIDIEILVNQIKSESTSKENKK